MQEGFSRSTRTQWGLLGDPFLQLAPLISVYLSVSQVLLGLRGLGDSQASGPELLGIQGARSEEIGAQGPPSSPPVEEESVCVSERGWGYV